MRALGLKFKTDWKYLVLPCFLIIGLPLAAIARVFFQPVLVIVPHHNMVKNLRQQTFKKVASQRPMTRTIIILSPNHFSSHQKAISFANKDWNLLNGIVKFDKEKGEVITTECVLENNIVLTDHGIYNLLEDINLFFPQAKIIPILIGQKVEFSELQALQERINETCWGNCLVIGSIDFSHYLPYPAADIHDVKSLNTLLRLNIPDDLENVEVDSPQSLFLGISFAKLRQASHFELLYHTNSAKLTENSDAESTSHIFGYYRRSLFPLAETSPVFTFTLAEETERGENREPVSERFFYGIDFLGENLSQQFSLDSLSVNPVGAEQSTVVKLDANLITINLGGDFVVTGYQSPQTTKIVFLPVSRKGRTIFFKKGSDKLQALQALLWGLQNFPNVSIDKNTGVIVLSK